MNMNGGWIASLNNGETAFEREVELGAKTSWQQLIDRLKTEKFPDKDGKINSLKIVALRLQRWGITFNAMPHKSCDGYMAVHEVKEEFFASMGTAVGRSEKKYQGIGSVVEGQVYITWVQLEDPRLTGSLHVYQEVRNIDTCKIHTTLR